MGMFFQRDIESMAQRLGEASPFTIEPVEEQSEQVPVVELSDWAWAIIRDVCISLSSLPPGGCERSSWCVVTR